MIRVMFKVRKIVRKSENCSCYTIRNKHLFNLKAKISFLSSVPKVLYCTLNYVMCTKIF